MITAVDRVTTLASGLHDMQMNKHKHLRSLLLALPVLALLAATLLPVVLAQTQDEPPAQTPVVPAATNEPEKPSAEEIDSSQQAVDPKSTASKPLKPFNPTEKIQADSAVAFPVDI